MPLVVWGVGEVLEAIGATYLIVVGLVFLLVISRADPLRRRATINEAGTSSSAADTD